MENKMATTKSISANTVKNVGGTGKNVGTKSDVLSTSNLGLYAAATGSVVVDGSDIDPALSAGTFANNSSTPVAKRVSVSLANVANSVLQSGAAVPGLVKSVHKIESIVTRRLATSIRAGHWNIYTGTFSTPPTVATDAFHKSVSSAPFIDKVANVSKSNPGVVVYRTGSKLPVTNTYGD
jgi:hypothetical protein